MFMKIVGWALYCALLISTVMGIITCGSIFFTSIIVGDPIGQFNELIATPFMVYWILLLPIKSMILAHIWTKMYIRDEMKTLRKVVIDDMEKRQVAILQSINLYRKIIKPNADINALVQEYVSQLKLENGLLDDSDIPEQANQN